LPLEPAPGQILLAKARKLLFDSAMSMGGKALGNPILKADESCVSHFGGLLAGFLPLVFQGGTLEFLRRRCFQNGRGHFSQN
jgi:hypothetical protein